MAFDGLGRILTNIAIGGGSLMLSAAIKSVPGGGPAADIAAEVIGSMGGGVVGNASYDSIDDVMSSVGPALDASFGRTPPNYDLARAARYAQLYALRYVVVRHRKAARIDPEFDQRAIESFSNSVLDWIKRERKLASSRKFEMMASVDQVASEIKSLLSSESFHAAMTKQDELADEASAGMWAELQQVPQVSDTEIPDSFKVWFKGGPEGGPGWFPSAQVFFIEILTRDKRVRAKAFLHQLNSLSAELSGAKNEIVTAIQTEGAALQRQFEAALISRKWLASQVSDEVRQRCEELNSFFVGRDSELTSLDEFLSTNRSGVLIVTGSAGSGKSALLSHWADYRESTGDLVIRHFVSGRYLATVDELDVLRHLAVQIQRVTDDTSQLPGEPRGLRDYLHGRLRESVQHERLIIVLDAIDEANQLMHPFLSGNLGDDVFVVVSCRSEGDAEPAYLSEWKRVSTKRLRVSAFDVQTVATWLSQAISGVSHDQLSALAVRTHRATEGLPLFLRYAVEDIREHLRESKGEIPPDAVSFRSIDQYVRGELDRLDQHGGPVWNSSVRFVFALLTRVTAPIGTIDLLQLVRRQRELGQMSGDLNLENLTHLIERWLTIKRVGNERRFSFAHPRLASAFSEALPHETTVAREALLEFVRNWKSERSAYVDSAGVDQLVNAAADPSSAVEVREACVPLASVEYLARYLRNGRDPGSPLRLMDALLRTERAPKWFSVWRSIVAESVPLLRRVGRNHLELASTLGAIAQLYQFECGSSEVELPKDPLFARLGKSASRQHARSITDEHSHWVGSASPLSAGRILTGSKDQLRVWSSNDELVAVLSGHFLRPSGAERHDGSIISWSTGELRLWSAQGELLASERADSVTGVLPLQDLSLVSWGHDGNVLLWSPHLDKRRVIATHHEFVRQVLAVSASEFVSFDDKTIKAFSLSDPEPKTSWQTKGISGAKIVDRGFLLWGDGGTLFLQQIDSDKRSIFAGHRGAVRGATARSDGTIVSWGADGTLRMWSPDGTCRATLSGHDGPVSDVVTFSNDTMVSWENAGRQLLLWSADGQLLKRLEDHGGWNGAFQLADGRILTWSSAGAVLQVWSPAGELHEQIPRHPRHGVQGAFQRPDGRVFSWGGDGVARFWTPGVKDTRGEEAPVVNGLVALRDGRFLSYGGDGSMLMWTADGVASERLDGHDKSVVGAVETKDGRVLSWSDDGTVRLWRNGNPAGKLRCRERIRQARELQDGSILAQGEARTHIWSIDKRQIMTFKGPSNLTSDIRELRGGGFLSHGKKSERRYSSESTQTAEMEGGVSYSISRVVGGSDKDKTTLALWGLDGSLLRRIGESDELEGVSSVLELADGRLAAACNGSVRVWSKEGALQATYDLWGRALDRSDEREGLRISLEMLPDGRIASFGGGGAFCLWSAEMELICRLEGHTSGVSNPQILSDGRLLSCSADQTLRLWSSAGDPLAVMRGHSGFVSGAIETQDGILSWSGDDETIRLWRRGGAPAGIWAPFVGHIRAVVRSATIPNRFGVFGGRQVVFVDLAVPK